MTITSKMWQEKLKIRLPATTGIFPPPHILLKMSFKRMKAFFFQKYFHQIFPNLKILIFLQTPQLRCKRAFWEIISFDSHLQQICYVYRFWKNQVFFIKIPTFSKTQISNVFEKTHNFSRILQQICYKFLIEKFQIQNRSGNFQLASQPTRWVDDFPSVL